MSFKIISSEQGSISNYTDVLGRKQTAVRGTKGSVLITRDSALDPYKVWFSDQLSTILTTKKHDVALQAACKAAGLDL